MDIYRRKSRWKWYLGAVGIIIVLISLVYTNFLSKRLAEGERTKAENIALAMTTINEADYTENLDLELQTIQSNTTIPIIIQYENGTLEAINFSEERLSDSTFLARQVTAMEKEGFEPISNSLGQKFYYKESTVLRLLRFFPLVQLILIASFIGFGYLGLSAARRSEQNRVWVGMAKETAHQLGTPISGMVAWLENLKLLREEDGEVLEIVEELGKDVNRLELIADRFSKIGSSPKLEPIDLYYELDQCRSYMERRAPRKVKFDFPGPQTGIATVNINAHLFDWVIENLLRNALDAMGSEGNISATIYEEGSQFCIDISDTGKGILPSRFKTVFQPGFTTKKRGWGLGLSLAKRIIEDYHKGKIFVKDSIENVGTTFTIKLPKAN